jgi:hypothetical protein
MKWYILCFALLFSSDFVAGGGKKGLARRARVEARNREAQTAINIPAQTANVVSGACIQDVAFYTTALVVGLVVSVMSVNDEQPTNFVQGVDCTQPFDFHTCLKAASMSLSPYLLCQKKQNHYKVTCGTPDDNSARMKK